MNEEYTGTLRRRVESLTPSQQHALALAISHHAVPASSRLVAFIEYEDGQRPSDESLREFLAPRLPQYMIPARFMFLAQLPRNPAGKIDRRALANVDTTSSTRSERRKPVAPRTKAEETIAAIWRDVLKVEGIGIDDDFFELGGDSLLSIRVIARAGREGLKVSPERFFDRPTIRQMATVAGDGEVAPALGEVGGRTPATIDDTGFAPLTPIQHWFIENIGPVDWWNQSHLVELAGPLRQQEIREIIGALIDHHAALRIRLVSDGGWRQQFMPPTRPVPLDVISLRDDEPEQYAARIRFESEREQSRMRLSSDPYFRCILFEGRENWQRLLVIAHHLVVDTMSWTVILEDLATLAVQCVNKKPLHLPVAGASARAWAISLVDLAATIAPISPADYWLAFRTHRASLPDEMRVPNANAPNRVQDAERILLEMSPSQTRTLLNDAPQRLGATTQAVLLAGLLIAWRESGGRDSMLLDIEGHGRSVAPLALDVSQVAGWFTTVFPVEFRIPTMLDGVKPSISSVVKAVQSVLDGLPLNGAAFGLHRYLARDEDARSRLAALPPRAVLFNFLGTQDLSISPGNGLRVLDEPIGRTRDPHASRAYELELNCYVSNDALTVSLEFSRALHDSTAIRAFGTQLLGAFETIIASLVPRANVGGFDAATLAAVAASLNRAKSS